MFSFEKVGMNYPCHFCGEITTRLDDYNFHQCEKCAKIGNREALAAMYPLAGTDERNPEYFERFKKIHTEGRSMFGGN